MGPPDADSGAQALPPSNTAAVHAGTSTDTPTARESFEDLFSYELPTLICLKFVLEVGGADAGQEDGDTEMGTSEKADSNSPHRLSRFFVRSPNTDMFEIRPRGWGC